MFRSPIRIVFSAFTVLVLTAAVGAQSNENPSSASGGDAASPQQATTLPAGQRARRARHTNCLKEAGIAPDTINERWKIQEAGKVKISGVCSDPKLTAEQRQDKIHGINDETDKEIARLIPAKQLSVYKSCETKLAAAQKARATDPQGKELGPCGGTIPANSKDHATHNHSAMTDEHN